MANPTDNALPVLIPYGQYTPVSAINAFYEVLNENIQVLYERIVGFQNVADCSTLTEEELVLFSNFVYGVIRPFLTPQGELSGWDVQRWDIDFWNNPITGGGNASDAEYLAVLEQFVLRGFENWSIFDIMDRMALIGISGATAVFGGTFMQPTITITIPPVFQTLQPVLQKMNTPVGITYTFLA